jgi:hypothetical protein
MNRILIFASWLVMCGCDTRDGFVGVVPGSTSKHLTFRVSASKHSTGPVSLIHFSVNRCSSPPPIRPDSIQWRLFQKDALKQGSPVSQIRYGVVPQGYLADPVAKPLVDGCYDATFGAGGGRIGTTRFHVKGDSVVRILDD